MSVEAPGTINTLDPSQPDGSMLISEGDNQIRNVKLSIKLTWQNVTGAILATHTEHNYLVGVTSSIQTQFNNLSAAMAGYAPLNSPTFTGIPRAPTAAAGSSGTQLATLDYVNTTAFSAALPGTAGQPDGSVLSINNGVPGWAASKYPEFLALKAGVY